MEKRSQESRSQIHVEQGGGRGGGRGQAKGQGEQRFPGSQCCSEIQKSKIHPETTRIWASRLPTGVSLLRPALPCPGVAPRAPHTC